MLVLGLTGGIASGKSAVAKELARLGAVVLNADEAAHTVINYPEIQKLLVDRWGSEVIKPDGTTDRRAIAGRVFGPNSRSRRDREYLESMLHPRIRAGFTAELDRLRASGNKIAVIDAPLLLEAGWDEICDLLVFVDSPPGNRQLRAETLRNWPAEEFAAREAAQMPITVKRERATHVLANEGTLDELQANVRKLWQALPAG